MGKIVTKLIYSKYKTSEILAVTKALLSSMGCVMQQMSVMAGVEDEGRGMRREMRRMRMVRRG